MELHFASYQLPNRAWTPRLYRELSLAFPRLNVSYRVTGQGRRDRDLLEALCVAHTEVDASYRATRGKSEGKDIKLVLSGGELGRFLTHGEAPELQWWLDHAPRPIFEAVQLDFPQDPIRADLERFVEGLNALVTRNLPVIFRITPANRGLFDAVAGQDGFPAIPLLEVGPTADDPAPFPAPYPGVTGYGLDVAIQEPINVNAVAAGLSRLSLAGEGGPAGITWLELWDSRAAPITTVAEIEPLYRAIEPWFFQGV